MLTRFADTREASFYDSTKVLSFFKTLKTEEVYLKDYQNFAEACVNLAPFIDAVYNNKRLYYSLGYRPPVEFEQIGSPLSLAKEEVGDERRQELKQESNA